MRSSATLKAGNWVEVRGAEEILRTLDGNAQLEGMPFMPEMLRFCGRRFRVHARAHKTCDTVEYVGGRRLLSAVHLEGLRCDGEAHGGCQALCLLFWKEAWLRQVDGSGVRPDVAASPVAVATGRAAPNAAGGALDDQLRRGTRLPGEPENTPDSTYVCQATNILKATVPLRRSDLGQYLEDLSSGNVSISRMAATLALNTFEMVVGGRYGLRWLLTGTYDQVAKLFGTTPYSGRGGKLPKGGKTPSRRLDLRPGELVRVRPLAEIRETVDEDLRNRGMVFHAEMVQFTGKTFRVLSRVERIVLEKTGKMIHLTNECVLLEGAVCTGRYIDNCRQFCPRSSYLYFREIWLERAGNPASALAQQPPPAPPSGG